LSAENTLVVVDDDVSGGNEPLSESPDEGSRIWLYDREGVDAPVELDYSDLPDPRDDQLLWADVDLESAKGLDELWKKLGITEIIPTLAELDDRPRMIRRNGLIQLNVSTVRIGSNSEPIPLHCLVGDNWIVTLHQGELDLVDEFNKPFHGDTLLGELDGPAFLSMVLDWQLGGYFSVIEDLQTDIDDLDEQLLQSSPKQVTDEVTLLQQLQELRMRVRNLRHTLSPHREVFGLLSHPESGTVVGSDAASDYERLTERLQLALDAVDTSREMIVASFDIFMTRTAQATNDIMKRLTIVSVLLLPAGVIAGIMGMNFRLGFFDRPWLFWVTLGVMATLATITLIVAKRRKWI
jgi:magnesium transporter